GSTTYDIETISNIVFRKPSTIVVKYPSNPAKEPENGVVGDLKVIFDKIYDLKVNSWIVLKVPVSNRDNLLDIPPTSATLESTFVRNLGKTGD
ncbi:MAG: hypothetical protein ACK56I_13290, partial [bacterium]